MAESEYLIFLDESEKRGTYFSNFYGGVIVGSKEYDRITTLLQQKKTDLNFFGEVKWSKVSATYLERYVALTQAFFTEVLRGKLRIRIMFRQNAHRPQNLTREQVESEYFMLYYRRIIPLPGACVTPDRL